ncbi:hypothetical protein KGF57_000257 [Candida theae]|uniref:DUF1783-domain-containing protein n=1 Tax=Candida theae TaxID=1198502 RepID=A0AAD5G0W2_9ASCO|nr:uncharacterized protein KGF57_000257 [Candida theae]KAI5968067.1 hypothetical protein KGF57_000257 [Candida theae]
MISRLTIGRAGLASRSVLSTRSVCRSSLLLQEIRQQQQQEKSAFSTTPLSSSSSIPHSKPVTYKPPVTIDRELPDPFVKRDQNRRYFVFYSVAVVVTCAIIFNYEKSSSPIVNSTLYFLRRSSIAQDAIGKNIEFASNWPWIWGKLNTVQGVIDVKFKVKGDERKAWVVLNASRESKMHPFEVHKFALEVDTKDSKVEYNLMDDPEFEFDL